MSFGEAVTSAMVADSLDVTGWRHQVLPAGITPLVEGTRIVGRARTVQFAPAGSVDPDRPYDGAIDFIDSLRTGDIAVVATDAGSASAFWGELFSAAAIGRGAVGVVTDGYLRDTDKIIALGFPAFGAGRRPIDFRGRMRVVATAERVVIGGVGIDDGDLVIADSDGIVVVPADVEDRVVELADARARAESTVLGELLAGDGLRAVWERHGIL